MCWGPGKKTILIIQVRNEDGLNQGSGIGNKEKWIRFRDVREWNAGVFVMVGRIENGVDEGAILSRWGI